MTETRVIVVVCIALVAVGLGLGVRWRRCAFVVPQIVGDVDVGEAARRYVWYTSIAIFSGVVAGVTIIGAGGRLAMRLLAVHRR